MTWEESQTTFTRPRLSPGTRLNGIYEIDYPIGVGGMGEVYRGHVIETGDPVAIKMMLPDLTHNEAALNLFRKEASALHHIQHDAVVRYYVFTVEPVLQRPYLAMEYVDGRTLSDVIQTDGRLSFEAVRSLMHRLASGLQAAHEHGIIHRDISPDNVIIPNSDVARAKIIDFGIARTTQHGTVIGGGFAGKLNYVSPEQVGLFGGAVTPKSDIYSLGLVLVEGLNGQALDMGGTHFDIVEKRRKTPDLGAVDMRFRPLLEKMLQPDPANRPNSMTAISEWPLGLAFTGRDANTLSGRDSRTSSIISRTTGRKRRQWWLPPLAALGLIALISIPTAFYFFYELAGSNVPAPLPQSMEVPNSQATMTETITNYIAKYEGGDCFFITPMAISGRKAIIEGLGSSTKPFTTFDENFRRTIGFEADIGVRQVTDKQCSALEFLNQLRGQIAHAPHLDIDQDNLHNGDVLSGVIDRYGTRNVELILVSDLGIAQNLSNLLKQGIDAKTFSIGMRRTDGVTGPQPQLLIAVASQTPVDALRQTQIPDADQYFAQALIEAAHTGNQLSATARYFILDK